MQLSPVAIRVLGSLVEKRLTTPDHYPLSIAALRTACNQRSAREPVMALSEAEVQQGLRELRDHDLARTSPVRGRVAKHEHTLERQLDLGEADQTVLGVLLLRGPQTVGEIRTRTERWHGFADLAEVETVLVRLAQHPFLPLVEELPLEPGRRESRWIHLLGDPLAAATAAAPLAANATDAHAPPTGEVDPTAGRGTAPPSPTSRLSALEERVTTLEAAVASLTDRLAPLLEDDE